MEKVIKMILIISASGKGATVKCSLALFKLKQVSYVAFPLQEEAGLLLTDLSSSLNTISLNLDIRDDGEVVHAATPIVELASNILNVASEVRQLTLSH